MRGAAIVTGGASGIGLALARALAERGHPVVLADIDEDGVAAAAEAIVRRGSANAEGVALDVADAAAVADLVERTHRQHRRLDVMCNNAGIGVGGEPEELTLQHWERSIDVNLRGVLHGCHAAYPVLKQQGSGHILNTASLAGLAPGTGLNGPYNLTKYGVVGLSLTLRAAGADHGVKVHALCPGVIDTPILDRTDFPGLPMTPGVAGVNLREFLRANGFGRPYPADRLAADALRGMARNRGLIIAPRSARLGWLVLRASPRLADALARTMTRRWRAHAREVQAAAPPI